MRRAVWGTVAALAVLQANGWAQSINYPDYLSAAFSHDPAFEQGSLGYWRKWREYRKLGARTAWKISAGLGYAGSQYRALDSARDLLPVGEPVWDINIQKTLRESGTGINLSVSRQSFYMNYPFVFDTEYWSAAQQQFLLSEVNSYPEIGIVCTQPFLKNMFGYQEQYLLARAEREMQISLIETEDAWERRTNEQTRIFWDWTQSYAERDYFNKLKDVLIRLRRETDRRTAAGISDGKKVLAVENALAVMERRTASIENEYAGITREVSLYFYGAEDQTDDLVPDVPADRDRIDSIRKRMSQKEISMEERRSLVKLRLLEENAVQAVRAADNAALPGLDLLAGAYFQPYKYEDNGTAAGNAIVKIQMTYPLGAPEANGLRECVGRELDEIRRRREYERRYFNLAVRRCRGDIECELLEMEKSDRELENAQKQLLILEQDYKIGRAGLDDLLRQIDALYIKWEDHNRIMRSLQHAYTEYLTLTEQLLADTQIDALKNQWIGRD